MGGDRRRHPQREHRDIAYHQPGGQQFGRHRRRVDSRVDRKLVGKCRPGPVATESKSGDQWQQAHDRRHEERLGAGTYTLSAAGANTTITGPLDDIHITTSLGFTGGATLIGSSANNIFNVPSSYVFQPTHITPGSGSNTVNVGSAGSLANIAGTVAVNDNAVLNINDSADTTHATATLDNLSGNVNAPFELLGLAVGTIEWGAGVTAVNITGGTSAAGTAGVTYDINNTQSGTTVTVNGGPIQNFINLSNAAEANGLDNLPGPVVVHGGASFADVVTLDDSSANFSDTYTVTSTTVTRIVFGGLTYDDNIGTLTLNAENSLGTNGDNNPISINGTADFVITNVNGQGGIDTVNVNDTGFFGVLNVTVGGTVNVVANNQPVNINLLGLDTVNIGSTGGAGTMASIQGPISIVDLPSFFDLNFHDENDTTARTWTLNNDDGLDTASVAVSPGGIGTTTYRPGDLDSASGLTINGGSGGNTFDVNGTTSFAPTAINGGGGDDTFNIDAAALGGTNLFSGGVGDDTFNLNIDPGESIGSETASITGVTIDGGDPSGNSVNRDRLNVNDNSGFARDLNYHYQSSTSGDLNIEANSAGNGLFGAAGGGFIPLVVTTMETLVFNNPDYNDSVGVTGVANSDDLITVALLPTLPASPSLPVGTQANGSALVFLGGTPYLNAPPIEFTNINPGDHDLPGVAGGGFGPDLLINGINANGITLDGGGNSGTNGQGDQAVVYAASEHNLVDTVGGVFTDTTNPNSPDIFGFGAGVLQPGFTDGNAYDTIYAYDSIGIRPSTISMARRPYVNLDTASFVQAGTAFAAQQPGLIVDGGDEASPAGQRRFRRVCRHALHQLQHPGQRQLAGSCHPSTASPRAINSTRPSPARSTFSATAPPRPT